MPLALRELDPSASPRPGVLHGLPIGTQPAEVGDPLDELVLEAVLEPHLDDGGATLALGGVPAKGDGRELDWRLDLEREFLHPSLGVMEVRRGTELQEQSSALGREAPAAVVDR